MEIKIFNSELTYLGVVDDFESFTFVSKYNACGNFKIDVYKRQIQSLK